MAGMRISDFVQPYSGEADVVQWLDKLHHVCRRMKECVADVLPLFLEGPAYAVYSEMSDDKKDDANAIAAVLKEAFGLDGFRAYEQLTSRSWRAGEPVDVFLAELRRLAKLAGVDNEVLLRRAFIVGLPTFVSRELRAMADVSTTALPVILDRARALMAESPTREPAALSSVATVSAHGDSRRRRADRRCFKCDGPHLVRDCPVSRTTTSLHCWTCGIKGHTSRECRSGNAPGRAAAPEALPHMQ